MPDLTYPYSIVAGDTPIAARVQGNFNAIKTLLEDTKLDGDNIQDEAITADLLAPGAISADALGRQPYVAVIRFGAQTLSQGVLTSITWNSEIADPDGFHSGTDTGLVVPAGMGGIYTVAARVDWEAGDSADTDRKVEIFSTDGTVLGGGVTFQRLPGSTTAMVQSASALASLADGESLRVHAYIAGETANTDVTFASLAMHRLGAE